MGAMLPSYEQLGLFYLGRRFDLGSNTRGNEPVLYESRDLVTHAVCVGMTGSGKTGLGITVIEEAALDQIPVLAIDPKGDLSNLLLTFPDLTPADFAPWVDERQAQSQQLTRLACATLEQTRWIKARVASCQPALDAAPLTVVWILGYDERPASQDPPEWRCRLTD